MKLKAINKKDHYYELIVEFSIFEETYEIVFTGTEDEGLGVKKCNSCPLSKLCNEEICCSIENLSYQTMPNIKYVGFVYMENKSALKIKEVLYKRIHKELVENNINEQPKSYESSEFELL